MAVTETKPTKASQVTTVLTPTPGPGTRRRPLYVPVKNSPGRLAMIHKNNLHIDPQYQRNINDRLVGRIMANWSWVSCGTLLVSKRPEARHFFIMDGQHRWKAAGPLDLVQEMPCLIFDLDSVRDEAIGFLASNTERRIPTLRDQFKALLITGDPAAKSLQSLADKHDRRISAPSGPLTISCVSDCMRLLRENRAAFERIFPLAAELCIGGPMTGRLLRGMCFIERHLPPHESLTADTWRRRLLKVGNDAIQISIKQIAMFENKGDDRTCGTGVLRAINKGLRLPLILVPNGR